MDNSPVSIYEPTPTNIDVASGTSEAFMWVYHSQPLLKPRNPNVVKGETMCVCAVFSCLDLLLLLIFLSQRVMC